MKTAPCSLLLTLASLSTLLVCSGCDTKAGAQTTSGSSESSAAAPAAPSTSASTAAEGEKPRVPHKMDPAAVCLSKDADREGSSLVAVQEDLWSAGSTLKIGFLDGTPELIDFVAAEASEWMQYANIKFEFHKDPANRPSDLVGLVSFECNGGSKGFYVKGGGPSRLRELAQSGEFNVCFHNVAFNRSPESYRKATVKHEFGHFLGLHHEQLNPDLVNRITWDVGYIHQWCKETQGWDEDKCDSQILAPVQQLFPGKTVLHTDFDKDSIMFYGISDPNFTKQRVTFPQPETISKTDKAVVAKLYPGNTGDPGAEPPREPSVSSGGAYEISSIAEKTGTTDGNNVYTLVVGIKAGPDDSAKIEKAAFIFPPSDKVYEAERSDQGFYFVGGKGIEIPSDRTHLDVKAGVWVKGSSDPQILTGKVDLGGARAPSPGVGIDDPSWGVKLGK